MSDRAAHWEQVYRTKADRETSWFQEDPEPSLTLIRDVAPLSGTVIDVGGGASALGCRLSQLGYRVTVLDIAEAAIGRAKERCGAGAAVVWWIVGDVLSTDVGVHDIWHDRAVYHFLTDPAERERYIQRAADSVRPGGHAVVGTFSLAGPEKCSGLPVARYDAARLGASFERAFEWVGSTEVVHTTPWGKPQAFVFVVLWRRSE